eukprot:5992299-Amphidinium_carterae.1
MRGQLNNVNAGLQEGVAQINKLPSFEQKQLLGDVRLAETRLAAVNLVLGSDGPKLQAFLSCFKQGRQPTTDLMPGIKEREPLDENDGSTVQGMQSLAR